MQVSEPLIIFTKGANNSDHDCSTKSSLSLIQRFLYSAFPINLFQSSFTKGFCIQSGRSNLLIVQKRVSEYYPYGTSIQLRQYRLYGQLFI